MKKLSPRNTVYINGVGVNTEKFHHVNINRNEYRESLGITAEQKMVLTVGEISKRKNQKVIVKALSKLDKELINKLRPAKETVVSVTVLETFAER